MAAIKEPASIVAAQLTTWYLLTTLARPASRRGQQAQLAEIVAVYGLRNWVERGYRQVKDELGWADYGSAALRRSGRLQIDLACSGWVPRGSTRRSKDPHRSSG